MRTAGIVGLAIAIFQSTVVFAGDILKIGTLSNYSLPSKLGEIYVANMGSDQVLNNIEMHIRDGSSLAFEEFCKDGVKAELKHYDSQGTVSGAITAIKQAEADGMSVLIGFITSSPVMAVNKLYPERKVPIITTMATNLRVGGAYPPTLQLAYDDALQCKAITHLYRALPAAVREKTILLTETTNPYSTDLSTFFLGELTEAERKHVRQLTYVTPLRWDSGDFNVQNMKDATLLLTTGEAQEIIQIVGKLSTVNKNYLLMGGDGWYRQSLPTYLPKGTPIPDTLTLGHWNERLGSGDTKKFVTKYQKRFRYAPGSTSALSWDAVHYICETFKLYHEFNFAEATSHDTRPPMQGLTGPIKFNPLGKQEKKYPIYTWFKNGRYHDVPIKP